MKIEIDLNDVLGGEDGAETLQESIRRQVIAAVVEATRSTLRRRIDEETSRVLDAALRAAVTEQMPAMVADLMNAEYVPTDRFGQRGERRVCLRDPDRVGLAGPGPRGQPEPTGERPP